MSDKPNYYVNTSLISFGVNDFVIETGIKKNRQSDGKAVSPEDIDLQIYMSPHYAKTFLLAFTQALRMYEEVFGNINIQGNPEAMQKYGIAVQAKGQ